MLAGRCAGATLCPGSDGDTARPGGHPTPAPLPTLSGGAFARLRPSWCVRLCPRAGRRTLRAAMNADRPEPQTAAELPADLAQAPSDDELRLADEGLHVMTDAEQAILTVVVRHRLLPKD